MVIVAIVVIAVFVIAAVRFEGRFKEEGKVEKGRRE